MNKVYPHQREVYASLRNTAETFLAGAWSCLPIRPRFSRLIVGPSGVGKTHLLRVLAKDLQLPLFTVSTTNWLPMGCSERGSRPTWLDLARFIHRHDRGIIFTDELDKLAFPTSWMTYLQVEIFSLLDHAAPEQLRITLDDDDEDDPPDYSQRVRETSIALAQNFLVVGGGAFQALWTTSKGSMGFGGTKATRPHTLNHSQIATVIPTELGNRFASPILCLRPMEVQDYRGMLRLAVSQMPPDLRRQIKTQSQRSLQSAVAHGLGCRWIEQLILEASIALHKSHCRKKRKNNPPVPLIEEQPQTMIQIK